MTAEVTFRILRYNRFAFYDAANNAPVFNFPHSNLLRQVRSFSRRAFRAAQGGFKHSIKFSSYTFI